MTDPLSHESPYGNFVEPDAPSYDQLIQCMRCGLCLPTCPTFDLYHLEKASPRGRLALMRAISEKRLGVNREFTEAMNLCLGCLACQTACPAGVDYGHLIERARSQAEIIGKRHRPAVMNWLRGWFLRHVLNGPHGLDAWMPLLRAYQSLGIQPLNLARLLPGSLGSWERMLPRLRKQSTHQALGELVEAKPPVRGRLGLLTGCLENNLLSGITIATARVLAHNGYELVIPSDQACCGALAGHLGELEIARQHARRNIDVFKTAGVEIVISDAAGCSAQLKEYRHLLSMDAIYRQRAERFALNARDITEFLAEHLPLRDGLKPLDIKVAYDDPCHLIHAQGISSQPRILIGSIPGVELVELPEASWCCGSAGTYSLTHVEEANALLMRKMDHLKALCPDILTTANTGCYIQLLAGVKEQRINVKVMHVVELLAWAYGEIEPPG